MMRKAALAAMLESGQVPSPLHPGTYTSQRQVILWYILPTNLGERMMNAVKSAWRSLSREKLLRIQGEFLWPSEEAFQLVIRQPNPNDDQSRRSIDEIPPEEIALAIKNLVRDSLSIERGSLLLYVPRLFGFDRAGNHIQKALDNAFDKLVETGQLVVLEGRVLVPN